MSNSFEKSVKGGTKVKLAPPKSKYVEHILMATQSGEAGVAEVFRTLTHRLRDSTWTVAFKALIIVHLMIKEGAADVTLAFLSHAPRVRLAVNSFTDVQTQGANIRRYAEYLLSRAQAYESTACDFVRNGQGRMKRLTVNKGLLRETEVVQHQIKALVECDLLSNEAENEISLMAFRLLTRDLLDLYNVENEAVMNVLSHYFEMSRPDAERAIKIYRRFCKQTELVVAYLSVARQYQHATRLDIPKLKHAPLSLAKSLQEYLDDKDFEINRRQYLAEQDAKKMGKPVPSSSQMKESVSAPQVESKPTQQAAASSSQQPLPKGPAPDLIDFFESIELNQQTMAQAPQQTGYMEQQQAPNYGFAPQATGFQQNGFATAQQTNPFLQQQQAQQPSILQTQFTGAGFGGYGPQPQQQQQQQQYMPNNQPFSPQSTQPSYTPPTPQMQSPPPIQVPQQTAPQSSNPFRASMMPPPSNDAMSFSLPQRQNTNPFARDTMTTPAAGNAFMQQQQQIQQSQPPTLQTQISPLQAQATGTNPFTRSAPPQSATTQTPANSSSLSPLQVQATGSTNPFRQSAFVNQETGMGWQTAPLATMGGWENLDTVPVFPRPGAGVGGVQQGQQGQGQQSPWG